jgi:predicted acetylornithine/succinylornithine family transaminase
VTLSAPASTALLGVYKPAAPIFVAGEGCRLIDEDGRAYIDFVAGIAVNALGYADAGMSAAIAAALESGLVHTSNLFRTRPAEELAAELVARSFADRVFFCNSGGEANEAAIKFARKWARTRGGAEKHEVVAFSGSFHGRLMGSLAITDRPAYQTPFTPLMPGAHIVDLEDDAAVRAVVSRARTAAIFVEPIQGEGGVRVVAAERLAFLRALADEADALLIFDEVQCGLARTGQLFAHEASGVLPDVMTLAKPLAGGLPMGATLLTERVAEVMQPGDHATTFGGGPLVASVALEVLRRVSAPEFLAHVCASGSRLGATVQGWTDVVGITQVRGRGLMWGIELDRPAAPVVAAALEKGLLLVTAGERVLRVVPPLVITEAELDAGLAILKEALA